MKKWLTWQASLPWARPRSWGTWGRRGASSGTGRPACRQESAQSCACWTWCCRTTGGGRWCAAPFSSLKIANKLVIIPYTLATSFHWLTNICEFGADANRRHSVPSLESYNVPLFWYNVSTDPRTEQYFRAIRLKKVHVANSSIRWVYR